MVFRVNLLFTYLRRSPLARGSAVAIYMAKRAGRSVVTSGATATATGAADATRARAAVAKEDRRSLIECVLEWSS